MTLTNDEWLYSVVFMFTKGRAMLDKRNNDNQTPLHVACNQGYFNSVQLLVEKGKF